MAIITEKSSFSTQFRMYLSVFLCFIIMMVEGTLAAWAPPMLKKLNETDDNPLGRVLTLDESSLLSAVGILGSLMGAFVYGSLAKIMGRKTLLQLMALPYIIFYLTLTFAKEVWLFWLAKFIIGLGSAGSFTILPMYICEISDPNVRGRTCYCLGVFKNIGVLMSYSIAPYVPFKWYHLAVSALPTLYLILFSLFAVESPYYFLQDNPREAERLLKSLRGRNDVSEELTKLQQNLSTTSSSAFWDVIKMKGTIKAILIAFGLITFFIFTGSRVITIYMQFIFDKAGGELLSADVETIIIGAVQLAVTVVTTPITDKFGKRVLFTISYSGIALSEAALGIYFILQDSGTDLNNFGWLPVVALACYIITTSLAVETLSIPILGELFPLRVKSTLIAFFNIYFFSVNFLLTFSFQRMVNYIGLGYIFSICSIFGICATIFIVTFMIETRGKTLEEVQDELNGN